MKRRCCLILIFFLSFTMVAWADEWPYDQICRTHNATSETVKLLQPKERTVVLCHFGVDSYIESITLDKSWTEHWQTWAVREYVENQPEPFEGDSCDHLGARIYPAVDSKGRHYQLCLFGDDSIMEEQTFAYGPGSNWNFQMDQALGL